MFPVPASSSVAQLTGLTRGEGEIGEEEEGRQEGQEDEGSSRAPCHAVAVASSAFPSFFRTGIQPLAKEAFRGLWNTRQ